MVKPVIVQETPIGMADLKHELELIKERDGELNFRANKTEEYLGQFTEITQKKQHALRKKLKALDLSRLKEEHIVKVLDLMPQSIEELKIVLQGNIITLTQDHMKKIVAVLKE